MDYMDLSEIVAERIIAEQIDPKAPIPAVEFDWLKALRAQHPERVKRFERMHKAPRFCMMVIQRRLSEMGGDFPRPGDLQLVIDSEQHSIIGIEVVSLTAIGVFQNHGLPRLFVPQSRSIIEAMLDFFGAVEVIIHDTN